MPSIFWWDVTCCKLFSQLCMCVQLFRHTGAGRPSGRGLSGRLCVCMQVTISHYTCCKHSNWAIGRENNPWSRLQNTSSPVAWSGGDYFDLAMGCRLQNTSSPVAWSGGDYFDLAMGCRLQNTSSPVAWSGGDYFDLAMGCLSAVHLLAVKVDEGTGAIS